VGINMLEWISRESFLWVKVVVRNVDQTWKNYVQL
jgi:hypothetical protein